MDDTHDGRDLVAALAETLRRFRDQPADVARAAAVQGVAVEVIEAALIASVVTDWLTVLPGLGGVTGVSLDAEAARAAIAVGAGRPVAVAVRLPPMLALRVVELAGSSGRTPEQAVVGLVADGADPAYAAICRNRGQPAPRPWNGGARRGS